MINDLTNRKRTKKLPSIFILNDLVTDNSHRIAKSFNDHFSSVVNNLLPKTPSTEMHTYDYYLFDKCQHLFVLDPTTPAEIENLIKEAKNAGVDGVKMSMLKPISPYISVPLANFFSLTYPSEIWRHVKS